MVNRFAATGYYDYPAVLDTTSSRGRSWAGSYLTVPAAPPQIPADNGWVTIDSFGYPGNWLIRATGTQVYLVPTLGAWGLIVFMALILTAALVLSRRKNLT